MGRYAGTFADNAIDEQLLPDLTDTDLKELGVTALGHRKTILKAIAALSDDQRRSRRATAPGHEQGQSPPAGSAPGLAAWERRPGERKPVTMLFADVTGSTALTESLDPEEAHELLYGAAQQICAAVENNRGTVCRFMGDGVMAMFGAPVASERHALDACQAAMEMQQAIRGYRCELDGGVAGGLQIRVGLHSGEVVVLTVGEADKVEYDASGPTVPIAARMEQAAKPGEVYLTAATHSLAGSGIETEALAPVSVKGVSTPLPVYLLRRVRAHDEAASGPARTPFVGRRTELAQLRAMLRACIEDGRGHAVCIRGEPGIGKTRLVSELTGIAARSGVACHRGLLLPFGVGKGQDAIPSIVRSLLGIAPGGGKALRRQAAQTALADARLDADQAVFLHDLLDLPPTTEQRALYDAMDHATRDKGRQAVASKLVASAAGTQPVCVVVEDVHWADDVTLAQLAALTATVAECAAMLVMTSRVDGDPIDTGWRATTRDGPFFTIDLAPLHERDSIELISGFIDCDDSLARLCLDRAAGNPLFLEQLLRTAQTDASARLPDSIQSLVLARLDRLDSDDKRALQAASVIGQRFEMPVLRNLLDMESYDCRGLIEHNLVRPEGAGYLFAHALVQEGVYGSLVTRQRRELHARAAQWFAGSDLALHARHLERAGDERAPRACLNAAREQARQYRYEASLELTERGLMLAAAQSDRHPLTCFKAELLLDRGEAESSLAVFAQAEQDADDDEQRCEARIGTAACLRMTGDCDKALAVLEQCEPILAERHRTRQLSRLHHLRGNLFFPLGNVDGCHEEHRRALEYAREAGSVEDEARALGGLGDSQFARGRMKSAHEALRMCVEKCRTQGLGRIEVANLCQLTNCQMFLLDGEHALRDSLNAAQAASRVSHGRAEMTALSGACAVAIELGDREQAQAILQRGLALTRKLKARSFESFWQGCSSQLFYLRGERRRACDELEAAIENEPVLTFLGAWLLGLLAKMSDDAATRARALADGEKLLQQGSMGESVLYFYRHAMDACMEDGDWPNTRRYATALEDYTSAEPLPWSNFFIARARVLAARGEGDGSAATQAELQRLRGEAERLGLMLARTALEQALHTR